MSCGPISIKHNAVHDQRRRRLSIKNNGAVGVGLGLSQIGFPGCSDIDLTSKVCLGSIICRTEHNQVVHNGCLVSIRQTRIVDKPGDQGFGLREFRNADLGIDPRIHIRKLSGSDNTVAAIAVVGKHRHDDILPGIRKLLRQECDTVRSITGSLQITRDQCIAGLSSVVDDIDIHLDAELVKYRAGLSGEATICRDTAQPARPLIQRQIDRVVAG